METDDYDAYSLVQGFYGPGALICWHLIMASVLVTWTLHGPAPRFKVSNDLVAALLFPFVAIGHSAYLALAFPAAHKPYLVANLTKLMFDDGWGPVVPNDPEKPIWGGRTVDGVVGHAAVDADAVADVLAATHAMHAALFPQVVALFVALKVTDLYAALALIAWRAVTLQRRTDDKIRRRERLLSILFAGSLLWWLFAKLVLALRCVRHEGYYLILVSLLSCWLPLVVIVWSLLAVATLAIVGARVLAPASVWRGPVWSRSTDIAVALVSAMVLGFWTWLLVYCSVNGLWGVIGLPPRTGISIADLDQGAAVAGGLMTLLSSVYSAVRWNREQRELLDPRILTESRLLP